jgi:lipopolysaccharide export system protein LptA
MLRAFFATCVVLGSSIAIAQSTGDSLPRLDLFGSGGGPRKQLGYEGTPLAKDPKTPKKAKGQTEITALEASFDQKTREAVFIEKVVVVDPEFNVACDRLTAYLKKPKAAGPQPPPSETLDSASKGGGLERAVAEANPGRQVIITQDKIEADGTLTKNIGKADKANYDAQTGDVILTGSPSVQQGINLCVATDPSTIMTLNRNGRMRVEGPHRTVIKDTASTEPPK